MTKNLKNLKWNSVAFDGFPIAEASDRFNGFIGLEECTEYGLDSNSKKTKKGEAKKRKKILTKEIPQKKVKLTNGFIVETCHTNIKPSSTSEIQDQNQVNDKIKSKVIKQKLRLGDKVDTDIKALDLSEMISWLQYQIPEEILKGLAEQGFKTPTKIQELTLPAAMFGRRDILGAAETGSGKTLAFGIPILAGIMRLKEKAKSGQDIYDIPFKKTSIKKKTQNIDLDNNKKNKNQIRGEKKKVESDGYESGSDSNDKLPTNESDNDYLEEIEVPIRKRKDNESLDEGNDSDESDNYVHLSDMDMVEDEDLQGSDVDNEKKTNFIEDTSEMSDQENSDIFNESNTGLGCVDVIDNVKLPAHVVVKTGKPLYALILTPTRELAIQISRHLIAAAKYTGIRTAVIVGGMAQVKQERVLSKSPEIVVATPGRLWELVQRGELHLQQLDNVKFLAIDETDRMVERNHFEELHPLLERLNSDDSRKNSRQNFVFSATLTLVHDLPVHMKGKKVTKNGKIINRKVNKMTSEQKVKRLVEMIGMTDPKVVDITTKNLGTAETLTECKIACSLEQKDYYLYYILKNHPGRTIVFCNSIGSVRRLAQLFVLLKCRPLPLHASMPQRQRLKNLERFRDDPHGVLIATDVAARGLDIPNVDHVIHYQVPRTAENYVHRSGRTARANKEGLTILMMEPGEAYLYTKLCRTLNKQSELPTFPIPPSMLFSTKQTVELGREVERMELQVRRASQHSGWLDKAARDMDMVIDEDYLPASKPKDDKLAKALQQKKKQLDSLLSAPIFPKGFSYKFPTLNESDVLEPKNEEKALEIMKRALESGSLNKQKRTSKNAPLLKLQSKLNANNFVKVPKNQRKNRKRNVNKD